MSVVTLAQIKDALNIPQATTTHDAELQLRIDEAEAEYTEWVRPLAGGTVRISGGPGPILLPRGVATVTAAYTDGTTIPSSSLDLDVDSGLLYLTSGLVAGTRNVTVTYTVTALPANHRAAIISDVAELWTRTQRGGGSGRPSFGGGELEPETPTRPLVLFPRIRALASPVIA